MIFWILPFLFLYSVCDQMLVSQEFTDYLKKHKKYEVVEYEDNIFKGWTIEEAKSMLANPNELQFKEKNQFEIPLYTEYKGVLPDHIDWREIRKECINPVSEQTGCRSSHWAFTLVDMLNERVNSILIIVIKYSVAYKIIRKNCCQYKK